MNRFIKALLIAFFAISVYSQVAKIKGIVLSDHNHPLEGVNISILNSTIGTSSSKDGSFEIYIPADTNIIISFSSIGYETEFDTIKLKPGELKTLTIKLKEKKILLPTTVISSNADFARGITRLNPRKLQLMPNFNNIEQLIKLAGMGISSSNELSSSYSVRGGNFDENLVYINEFEVYRPFLISEGQQEGLPVINSQLIQSIDFSSGGFEAQYGDKMSSVLDIRYRKPQENQCKIDASLIGSNVAFETVSPRGLFTTLTGIRYKTTQYLLKTLDTQGDYKPFFVDAQTQLTYQLNEKWDVLAFGYLSLNKYQFIPHTRKTSFGTINEAYQLTIYFDGQERDLFKTWLAGLKFNQFVSKNLWLKYIFTLTQTHEEENYDIMGQYWLGQLETDPGSDQYGNVAQNLGIGTHWKYARNSIRFWVANAEHKGKLNLNNNYILLWGVKSQMELVKDKLWQWYYIDSAGFSLPHPADSVGYSHPELQPYQYLNLYETNISSVLLQSTRYTSFLQLEKKISLPSYEIYMIGGMREHYWTVNKQLVWSPRFSASFRPKKRKDESYRVAFGWYHQPPMYRELRDPQGKLYLSTKAQRAIHIVAGVDKIDTFWNRPFKIMSEAYYKKLDHLIPFYQDNVNIQYLPDQSSHGYAIGVDFKMFGQFVPDVDSWFSFSLMQTKEDIFGDYYYKYYNAEGEEIIPGITADQIAVDSVKIEPGYIPRPTDRRVSVNLFFQDYMPNNPKFKMHMNLVFATGLPFGPPNSPKYLHKLRMPPYRRVDIGFSREFKFKNASVWFSLEVFNLLNINNTISYLWVMDVEGRKYAVPNYLTARQLNFRMIINL